MEISEKIVHPPLGVGSAYVVLKACLQTCRKRGRLLLTRRRLEPSPSEDRQLSWNKSYSSDLTEYTFVFLINLTAIGDRHCKNTKID
jgi:hypothetical protein